SPGPGVAGDRCHVEPKGGWRSRAAGDFREHREVLAGLGHETREIRKVAQLDELDALIIPGGESTTIARLILSNGFQGPLRSFCASGRPVWGTCAGAILLAKSVDRLDRPGIEV